jgi:O-antigen ligase
VQSVFLNLLVDHAHCDYLEVVSELGVPGGILVFTSIFWILAQAVRRYRKSKDRFESTVCLGCIGGIVAICVHSLADFNLHIPANALVFAVTLALAWKGPAPPTVGGKSSESSAPNAAVSANN